MEKANKDININVRVNEIEKQKLDDFSNFWFINGVKMSGSELARNAMEEYIEMYDRTKVILEGNMVGVRVNPLYYNFADLFNMLADAQDALAKETNPSKKYLLGKQFELLQNLYNIETSAMSIKNAYKVETPEQLTALIYRLNKNIVGNVGGRK